MKHTFLFNFVSIRQFDYEVSSLVYLYLVIFVISILIYTLEFKNNQTAISILVFFLVSYYFILLAVIKSPHLDFEGACFEIKIPLRDL